MAQQKLIIGFMFYCTASVLSQDAFAALNNNSTPDVSKNYFDNIAGLELEKAQNSQSSQPLTSITNDFTYLSYSERINLAKKYIDENNGEKALQAIKALLNNTTTFEVPLIAAQAYASMNNPVKALDYYRIALKRSQSISDMDIAQNGISKMEVWIEEIQKPEVSERPQSNISYDNIAGLELEKAMGESTQYEILDNPNQDTLTRARQFIDANQGWKALEILKPLLNEHAGFDEFILTAQAYAITENPIEGLRYFNSALTIAKTKEERNIASSGKDKMKRWIKAMKHIAKPNKPSPLQRHIALAKSYLENDQGEQALEALRPFLNTNQFDILILAAQSYATLDKIKIALEYYSNALIRAKNLDEKHVAQFGMAKMQFILGNYETSKCIYELILKDKLNPIDHELALAGKIKSLAYMDRPIQALKSLPDSSTFATTDMVVAAIQATLWSNEAYNAKAIFSNNQQIIQKMNPNSALGKQLLDAEWQTNLETWPNEISPVIYRSIDSEHFEKVQENLNYRHYWSKNMQTILGVKGIQYRQNGQSLNAKGIHLNQTWQPSRAFILNGKIEPTDYQSWHPLLWSANLNYQPNDIVGYQVMAVKEVVETFPAFNNNITDVSYSANLNFNPIYRLTLDGALSQVNFSDTNIRQGYYAAISALVLPDFGLNLMLTERGYTSKFTSPNYFSPSRYVADTAILRLSGILQGVWHYYIDGGLGSQLIVAADGSGGRSPTHQWGLGLNGPLKRWLILNLYYSMTNQASSFIDSPNYRYQQASLGLTFLL